MTSVLIIAESGTGKSTSMRNLNPKETFIINPSKKTLPFKGWKKKYTPCTKENPQGNIVGTTSVAGILKTMKHINDNMPHIKNLVIDDWQHMSSFEYFEKANEKNCDKFTQIAANLAAVAKAPRDLRDDLTVIFLTHSEYVIDHNGHHIVKEKMIDNTLILEELFSIVLFGVVRKNDDNTFTYGFETQNNEENTCKSPMGMFEEAFIPNDLQYVIDCMIAYKE